MFAAALVAYVIGSIPFGYLIVRGLRGTDVRSEGSGNIGATNVLRTTGRAAGIATLALDVAKGVAAVLLCRGIWGDGLPIAGELAYLCVVAGHIFPIALAFRGGKGVACAAGGAVALAPLPAAGSLAALALVIAASRRVSAGSLAFAILYPVLYAVGDGIGAGLACVAGASALVILRHAGNIRRLAAGTEPRLGNR